VAYCLAVRPGSGERTWTVVDASYATVGPVEECLEAHRYLRSPNTVRGYATSLAQWWSFLAPRAWMRREHARTEPVRTAGGAQRGIAELVCDCRALV